MADSVNGEERLNQILEAFPEKQINTKGNGDRAEAPTQASSSIAIGMDFCQWSAGPNETYRPSGPRREKLPSGIYMVDSDPLEWVERTEGFSIAHLRELALAVFCLEQPAESVLDRLSRMQYQPRAMKEFLRPSPGFTPREELSGVDRATSACMPSGA